VKRVMYKSCCVALERTWFEVRGRTIGSVMTSSSLADGSFWQIAAKLRSGCERISVSVCRRGAVPGFSRRNWS